MTIYDIKPTNDSDIAETPYSELIERMNKTHAQLDGVVDTFLGKADHGRKNKSADHEDLVSPGYTIAWALAGFALFCMVIGAVVMKIAMGG